MPLEEVERPWRSPAERVEAFKCPNGYRGFTLPFGQSSLRELCCPHPPVLAALRPVDFPQSHVHCACGAPSLRSGRGPAWNRARFHFGSHLRAARGWREVPTTAERSGYTSSARVLPTSFPSRAGRPQRPSTMLEEVGAAQRRRVEAPKHEVELFGEGDGDASKASGRRRRRPVNPSLSAKF